MKIIVKTLKGTRFEIQVKPEDTVADVKKNIETVLGATAYPAAEQMLIHKGKMLKDETTMEANDVSEKSFIAVMKRKPASTGTPSASSGIRAQAHAAPPSSTSDSLATSATTATETPRFSIIPLPPVPPTEIASAATSNVADESISESRIQQILQFGRGNWNRDMVTWALCFAYNDIEKAVGYLHFGIPVETGDSADRMKVTRGQTQEPEAPAEADPEGFYHLPEDLPDHGSLDFLRHTQEFQILQPLVQSDPSLVKRFLETIKEIDPPLFQFVRANKADFLHLLKDVILEGGTGGNEMAQAQELQDDVLRFLNNEPSEGGDGGNQVEKSEEIEVNVTPEEYELIQRLEAMGFETRDVLEVFFACNKNAELAANYLLDHIHEFQE